MASRPFWSVHNHSLNSSNDALASVVGMVDVADSFGWPALGLTDHGMVAGNIELYKACRRKGIEPLPGIELYLTPDREGRVQGHNLHLTVNAYTEAGYNNLCRLVTTTARNFYYKPRIDFADLAQMAEDGATQGLSIATGCWFGVLPTIVREQGFDAAVHMAKTLAGWFPRVYVELQAHGIIPEEQTGEAAWITADGHMGEDEMVATLVDIAGEAGLPYIITCDAHYLKPEDQQLHNGLKKLCSWSDAPDDAVFPGGPYALMNETMLKDYFEPDVLETACANLSDLAEAASVRIPAVDTFRMLVPNVAKTTDPMAELREMCMEGLRTRIGEESGSHGVGRLQRMNHELDIIEQTGFETYILLIASICRWMDTQQIVYNARGSANNSLVNYLCRITNVDSYGWASYRGLRFERFISIDRIKPPDVDLDIEHARRDEVTAYAATQFTVCQVGTIMKYSLFDEENEGKGSLRVRYFATRNKQGLPKVAWREIPQEDRDMLFQLGHRKLVSGYGTHPAGLILAPDADTIADLPMVHIGTGKKAHLVTAYAKDTVEDLGFIKGDFLGLRFLSACATAARLIMEETGQQLSPIEFLQTIPLNDPKVYARISNGKTVGTFQLGERAATDFVTRMRPKHLDDLVAALALMRPAALNSGTSSTFLGRRKGVIPTPAMHPDLERETKFTRGLLVYQEQVIGACRAIGMDMSELNTLLKAVKSSNEYVAAAKEAIEAALPRIRSLGTEKGWSEADIEVLVEAITGYGDYGFNEGHAAGYGLFSVWTAWMAEYYPAQWWTGLLGAYAGEDEENYLMRVARSSRYGVRIIGAHVNDSKESYTYDRRLKAVRRGLLSVKGVGQVSARELASKAPYKSLDDLGKRVLPSRVGGAKQLALKIPLAECGGVIKALLDAGALDGLD